MIAALLTAVCFSLSVVFAARATRLLGGMRANFTRLCVATLMLAAWAHGFGRGWEGGVFGLLFLSGCVGFGLGDVALYQALPRLGSRLTILLVQCLAAPIAAVTEWLWLGTRLSLLEIGAAAVLLLGVSLALGPGSLTPTRKGVFGWGAAFGAVAAIGQAGGAVLSRVAYQSLDQSHQTLDGGTAAYQRIIGGLLVSGLAFGWSLSALNPRRRGSAPSPPQKTSAAAWPWVLANSLSGPVLGVACYQWALATTPSGVVLPIVATTPLVVMPFAYVMEGDRPDTRALWGGLIAVLGAAALAWGR